MIITSLKGGLGNQMFQYAIGRSLSVDNKTQLKLDTSFYSEDRLPKRVYKLNSFNIKAELASTEEIAKLKPASLIWSDKSPKLQSLLEKITITYVNEYYSHGKINRLAKNYYLEGNWQSEDYFENNKSIIRDDFSFKDPLSKKAKLVADKIKKENSISVHVRRTDYVNRPKGKEIVNCSLNYYKKALELIHGKVKNPIFYIFSDDIEWCKKNLNFTKLNLNYLFFDEITDLHLITLCKHNVTANSSFSWWGAWLNKNPKKIIISPEPWLENSVNHYHSYVPDTWLKIPKV